jgi:TolB-like protein/ketosteroid isomerase-like protein
VESPPATSSALWLLSIGVSHYQDADFNLQFAAADAQAIAGALEHQGEGPLYSSMKTLVLTDEEVTRESILGSMERFLGQAGPQDIAVIFVAGHGVQDLATGSYYFLPYPATAQNLVTAGLRMSDFDEMVRTLRRNIRGVVVMLDTCHAGALRLAARGFVSADDLAARMSVGEGSFLLAATKPGEESIEKPELEHGAFTYSVLEGLGGAADADGDGLVSVSEIFGYVARLVPRLTQDQQHPYHKMEGTDLVFAAVPHTTTPGASAPGVVAIAQPALKPTGGAATNTIGVMEFHNLRADPEHEWVGQALRVVFNTELNKVRQLHVYAPELIDRTVKARGSDQLYTAQQLGIGRVVSGSFQVVGDAIRIDARILNATTGLQEGSDSVEGNLSDFFDLQKKLVLSMLRRLPVQLSPEEGASIETKTNTNVDAYRLMLQAEGVVEEPKPSPALQAPTAGPQSCLGNSIWKLAALSDVAYAEGPDADVATAVRQVLEDYRNALERKDLDRMASLYVVFPPRQREALREYLDNAAGLTVEVADVAIAPRGEAVAVSYTRRDHFVDKGSNKAQRLEVRLTKILVRQDGKWKITGGQ